MIYEIENKTPKKWQEKDFIEAELVDEKGEHFKVSAWAGEFNGIDAWDGELTKNDKGYWKLVGKKPIVNRTEAVSKSVEKAQIRTEKSVAKFQDAKEWSIKVSSTMNHACDLAIAEFKVKTILDTLDTAVLKWRKFLWDNWEVNLEDTDPTDGTLL